MNENITTLKSKMLLMLARKNKNCTRTVELVNEIENKNITIIQQKKKKFIRSYESDALSKYYNIIMTASNKRKGSE